MINAELFDAELDRLQRQFGINTTTTAPEIAAQSSLQVDSGPFKKWGSIC